MIQEVIEVLTVRAREKGITLELEISGKVPAQIHSDPAGLHQIVTNPVGNAIKFTEHGGVQVQVTASALDGTLGFEINVVDTGVGMTAAALERIFEPFVQADSSVTRRFGGTGLGLAISRKFARALGGDITAEREPGAGSRFMVRLAAGCAADVAWIDAGQALAQLDGVSAAGAAGWAFPKARVLVVDDGPENRELVKLVLQCYGLVVEEAENGQIGVEMATTAA